jgi:hypothetical protein
MSFRSWRPALAIAVIGTIAAFALLAPHRVATSSIAPNGWGGSPTSQTVTQPGEPLKITPAEAGRDATDWRMLVGDQSGD